MTKTKSRELAKKESKELGQPVAGRASGPEYIPGIEWQPGSVGVLPVFRGYTVDERLREFRRVEHGVGFEIVPFDSVKGRVLLAEYRFYRDR